jgi:DNA-directed RNA polymerase subunit K
MSANVPITKYEKARIIGARATQLSHGAEPTTDIGDLYDPIKIAIKEYEEGTIPINIIRTLPNGTQVRVRILPRK